MTVAAATGGDVNLNTGRFTAIIAEEIYSDRYPTGVHHVEELFELADVKDRLEEDLHFHLDATPELVTTYVEDFTIVESPACGARE